MARPRLSIGERVSVWEILPRPRLAIAMIAAFLLLGLRRQAGDAAGKTVSAVC